MDYWCSRKVVEKGRRHVQSEYYSNQPANDDIICARNVALDRRQNNIRSAYYSMYRKRRSGPRREVEVGSEYYVDLHESKLFYLAISALMLSIIDCFFTLTLLQHGSEELNPFMDYFLQKDNMLFFVVKFLITTCGLFFLIMHKNFKLFKIISGYQLLVGAFLLYVCLVSYELNMMVKLIPTL